MPPEPVPYSSHNASDGGGLAFVIRIWIEEPSLHNKGAKWRGHITHIPSSERRYFEHLRGMSLFIMPYLARQGVHLRLSWIIQLWMYRRTQRRRKP